MPTSLSRPGVLAVIAALVMAFASGSASRTVASMNDEGEVRVINTPDVRLTSISPSVLQDLRRARLTPSFLREKKRYAFVWNAGEPAHVYVVVAVHDDGWIGVVVSDSPQAEFVTVADPRDILWLNVTNAFSIREIY